MAETRLVVRERREEDLRQWTKLFALRIIRLFGALPPRKDAQILGQQVLRSGTSVGANYREAYRARSDAEFLAKMGDSLKELEETAYWLELLSEGNILPSGQVAPLLDETGQLTAIFVAIIKHKKANMTQNS